MGKVRQMAEEWARDVQMMAFRAGSGYTPRPCEWLRAEAEDAAAHAAELEAKDKRIAELEAKAEADQNRHALDVQRLAKVSAAADDAGWNGVENPKSLAGFVTHQAARIRELEEELAKRVPPPLPELIKAWANRLRSDRNPLMASELELIAWVDTHYPAPVPQWELDARMVEKGGVLPLSEATLIAARIREAGRGSK